MQLIKLFLAIANAFPIVDKWYQDFLIAYVKMQKEKDNAEFLAALETAKTQGSTRDLQRNLGGKL